MGIRTTSSRMIAGSTLKKLANHISTEGPGISKINLTPTTWDPDNLGTNHTTSNGDLTLTQGSGAWNSSRTIFSASAGKFYVEFTCTDINASGYCMLGVTDDTDRSATYFGTDTNAHAYYALNGQAYNSNSGTSFGDSYTDGDVISMAIDLDNSAVYFAKNGVWQNASDPESGATKTGVPAKHELDNAVTYYVAAALYAVTNNLTANFGGSAFTYSVPEGYTAGWGEVAS